MDSGFRSCLHVMTVCGCVSCCMGRILLVHVVSSCRCGDVGSDWSLGRR